MNHNDPQLNDTPTRSAAAAPDIPDRTNSKYRRFTHAGRLFHAYRGTRTPSYQDSQRPNGNRPVYCAFFIDAIHVKVRDGQIANRPVYAAIGVTMDGRKDVLGL